MSFPAFDLPVHDNGYRWWYVDAISDDGKHALTCIAFVGSVFSPYYAWARRRRPLTPAVDYCAINLALYGRPARWCMTERDRASVARSADQLTIGPSSISRQSTGTGGRIQVVINEVTMPWLTALRGTLQVTLPDWNIAPQPIDRNALHWWQPIAPHTRIRVEMSAPKLSWSGSAYVDCNAGCIPLESSFRRWEWSRLQRSDGATDVQYDVVERDGHMPDRTFRIGPDGTLAQHAPSAGLTRRALPSTRWWRIPRTVRLPADTRIDALQTLEDAPFYARSRFHAHDEAGSMDYMQESLLLDRFDHPVTRCLLPFRMPRLTGRFARNPNTPS